jgi:hypothetical protein
MIFNTYTITLYSREAKVVAKELDITDAQRMYEWTFAACRDAPPNALARRPRPGPAPDVLTYRFPVALPQRYAETKHGNNHGRQDALYNANEDDPAHNEYDPHEPIER